MKVETLRDLYVGVLKDRTIGSTAARLRFRRAFPKKSAKNFMAGK